LRHGVQLTLRALQLTGEAKHLEKKNPALYVARVGFDVLSDLLDRATKVAVIE
jgi:hypothetical protein